MRDRTIAEILRAAAARVREGWCQHTLDDGMGGACALGAINVGCGRLPDGLTCGFGQVPAILAVMEALQFGTVVGLIEWNNAPDQTAENVAAGLELAALIWEQQQQTEHDADQTRVGPGVESRAETIYRRAMNGC